MNDFRYELEKYKGGNTRHICPGCEKKTFTLYIDTNNDQPVHDTVGRCNREINCGYHLTPKDFFDRNGIAEEPYTRFKRPHPIPKPTSYIDNKVVEASLRNYDQNHLIKFMNGLIGIEATSDIIARYKVGTSKYWNGATVYWQIDTRKRIRAGKIIQYNSETGKRSKINTPPVQWVHKVLALPDYKLDQCLFGEHLLIGNKDDVAIVESEKTAMIAAAYFPQFIWLATGGLNNLNADMCKPIEGRTVVLFPDMGACGKWEEIMNNLIRLMPSTHFRLSTLLETNATDQQRKDGWDIADLLVSIARCNV